MQQEDDLRGLAKIMEFMRAISILFCVINVYDNGIDFDEYSFNTKKWQKGIEQPLMKTN